MAKRECPFCKEKVQEKATICKHCKSELPPLPPKKWYQTWKGLLLVLFILWVLAQVFGRGPTNQPTNKDSNNKSSTSTTDSQISDCERAKAQFRVCEKLSGDSFVNCLAGIHAPEGCGEVSIQHLEDKAKQR
jgi:hypothetical protein